MATKSLSLTPRFSGMLSVLDGVNRFNGFRSAHPSLYNETAKTVQFHTSLFTLLKRGVNETVGFKTRRINLILLFLMITSVFGAPLAAQPGRATNQPPIVAANTGFALDLYQREKSNPGNLFFSPYSLSTALAMTYSGARGQTAAEMARVLHFNLPQSEVPPAFAELTRQLDAISRSDTLKLDIANSLWCQKEFPFTESFLALTRDAYHAEARSVDFLRNTESVRTEINSWVEEKTQDKIRDLIQPGQLDPTTRLVLCNAIYFKGQWADRFEVRATQPAPFFAQAGQPVQVPMMARSLNLRMHSPGDFTMASLPYVSNELSMIILLPKNTNGLSALEQRLHDGANLNRWLSELDAASSPKTDLFLPKFKLNCRLLLARTLSGLGMPTAFSASADFSGISTKPALQISDVVHQAFVDVNEEGTEAAAATGVIMRLAAVQQRPPVFRVDHPFVFLIRENRTGSILFLGRVIDPSK
jgi:serpin B